MTDTPRLWDRLPTETLKSHAAFLAYVALGARRSVREAARQYHIKTISTGEISSDEDTKEDQAFLAGPALSDGQGRVAALAVAAGDSVILCLLL